MAPRRVGGLFRKRVAVVDARSCRGCALCVASCPLGALRGSRGEVPVVDEGLCIGCGICVEACPFNVISLRVRWSLLPIATLAFAAVAALAVGLWVLGAGGQPMDAGAAPARADEPGGFELPYEASGGGGAPAEFYAELEEEAGTEGG